MNPTDYDCEVVWCGAMVASQYGYHERGELLPDEMRRECSALSKMITPKELERIEAADDEPTEAKR